MPSMPGMPGICGDARAAGTPIAPGIRGGGLAFGWSPAALGGPGLVAVGCAAAGGGESLPGEPRMAWAGSAAIGTGLVAAGLTRTGPTVIRGRTMDFLGPDAGSLPFGAMAPWGPVRLLGGGLGRFGATKLGFGKLPGKFRGATRGDDWGSNVGAFGVGCACRLCRAITPPKFGDRLSTTGPGAPNEGFAEPGAPTMPAGERG